MTIVTTRTATPTPAPFRTGGRVVSLRRSPAALDPATATAVEALFASDVQPSWNLTGELLAAAVTITLKRLGVAGCAQVVAGEFAEHPETAVIRMTWVRKSVGMIG